MVEARAVHLDVCSAYIGFVLLGAAVLRWRGSLRDGGGVFSCRRLVVGLFSMARSPASGVRSVGTNNWPLW